MSDPTIAALGTAKHQQPPSFVLLSGLLDASAPTLSLAIEQLNAKCNATRAWLERLEAVEIVFYEPRFPDQAEPNPMQAMQQMRQRMAGAGRSTDTSVRKVQKRFTALWPVEGKTADEMLIFSDRLLFEASEAEEDAPQTPNPQDVDWTSPEDLGQHMAEMMEQFQAQIEPTERDMNVLFLTRLSPADRQNLVTASIEDATQRAKQIAVGLGVELGDLVSATDQSSRSIMARQDYWKQHHAFVNEIPYGNSADEIISFGPKQVTFEISSLLSFALGSARA